MLARPNLKAALPPMNFFGAVRKMIEDKPRLVTKWPKSLERAGWLVSTPEGETIASANLDASARVLEVIVRAKFSVNGKVLNGAAVLHCCREDQSKWNHLYPH